jgi:hypothetical protein
VIAELLLEVCLSFDGIFPKIIQPVSSRVREIDREVLDHKEGVQGRRRFHGKAIVYQPDLRSVWPLYLSMLRAQNLRGVGAYRILYPNVGGPTRSQESSLIACGAGSGRFLTS